MIVLEGKNKCKSINNNIKKFLSESGDISDLKFINEAYFKDSPDMNKMVSLIKKYRDNLFDKKIKFDNNIFDETSKDSTILELNRAVERFFGFKTFAIKIVKYEFWNAWTVPVSCKVDVKNSKAKDYIRKTDTGYRFVNNDYNCIMVFTSGILLEKTLNERDIMGIMLHEIGHNFSFAINNIGGVFGNFMKVSNIVNELKLYIDTWIISKEDANDRSNDVYNEKKNNITKLAEHIQKKDDSMINIAGVFMKPFSFLFNIGLYIYSLYRLIYGFIPGIIYNLTLRFINPIDLMIELFGYNDEKVADNFATMYGFGPEVAKFESKIYTVNAKYMSELPFIAKLLNVIFYPVILAMTIHDPHPKHLLRIQDQINLLENELEKEDLDPKMKAVIKEDIKNVQKELDKTLKSMNKYDSRISVAWDNLMLNLFGGDFREIWFDNKKTYDQYDNVKKL